MLKLCLVHAVLLPLSSFRPETSALAADPTQTNRAVATADETEIGNEGAPGYQKLQSITRIKDLPTQPSIGEKRRVEHDYLDQLGQPQSPPVCPKNSKGTKAHEKLPCFDTT